MMPKIGTAFRTISNRKVVAKLLYLLDSYRRTTPSPGHQNLPDISKKTNNNLVFSVFLDHFRDRFWDHLCRFRAVICQVWRVDLGCTA
ncbi:hypothetical protein SKA53_11014 [Yoonia vestfoldensis SKA53]|uniref:Uncharacterized protein n=1 Tax=Yoonia vestfoldensis SKA53 TaxID=314232 RepID=A3V1W7_9RHOB|nr:hypothetical protein SKA53_11014 [Yoonia vestfoldensis SKA53]